MDESDTVPEKLELVPTNSIVEDTDTKTEKPVKEKKIIKLDFSVLIKALTFDHRHLPADPTQALMLLIMNFAMKAGMLVGIVLMVAPQYYTELMAFFSGVIGPLIGFMFGRATNGDDEDKAISILEGMVTTLEHTIERQQDLIQELSTGRSIPDKPLLEPMSDVDPVTTTLEELTVWDEE